MSNGYNRDTLLADLRQNSVEIHFTKVDGTLRVMRATLMPRLLPVVEGNAERLNQHHHDNPDVIAVWDLENRGWRSFRVDSIAPGGVQILGAEY